MEEDAEAMQEELREAFRMYDKEGNGFIPTSALREILRALDDKLTEDELDEMIAEIDTDGSGTVDFDGLSLCPSASCSRPMTEFVCCRVHGNDDRRLDWTRPQPSTTGVRTLLNIEINIFESNLN